MPSKEPVRRTHHELSKNLNGQGVNIFARNEFLILFSLESLQVPQIALFLFSPSIK